jgi:hypothetical protein
LDEIPTDRVEAVDLVDADLLHASPFS